MQSESSKATKADSAVKDPRYTCSHCSRDMRFFDNVCSNGSYCLSIEDCELRRAEKLAPALSAPVEAAPKCGVPYMHLIAGHSYFVCGAEKGHHGDHRGEGNCFKHGPYLGDPGQAPQCPHWPDCVTPAPKVEDTAVDSDVILSGTEFRAMLARTRELEKRLAEADGLLREILSKLDAFWCAAKMSEDAQGGVRQRTRAYLSLGSGER